MPEMDLDQVELDVTRKIGWTPPKSEHVHYDEPVLGHLGMKPEIVVPEAWNQTINFGGGAKWFPKPHLGAGFDIRFVKLGSRSPTDVLASAKRTQQWTISAGISVQ